MAEHWAIKMDKFKQTVLEAISERGLTSTMNKTKWENFVKAMRTELSFPPPYHRKDIFEEKCETFTEDVSYWGDYFEGLHPFITIEWLEVRPRITVHQGLLIKDKIKDKIEDIENEFREVLIKLKIPYKVKNNSYFIYGYTRDFNDFLNI